MKLYFLRPKLMPFDDPRPPKERPRTFVELGPWKIDACRQGLHPMETSVWPPTIDWSEPGTMPDEIAWTGEGLSFAFSKDGRDLLSSASKYFKWERGSTVFGRAKGIKIASKIAAADYMVPDALESVSYDFRLNDLPLPTRCTGCELLDGAHPPNQPLLVTEKSIKDIQVFRTRYTWLMYFTEIAAEKILNCNFENIQFIESGHTV